jgi:hypothetical protein
VDGNEALELGSNVELVHNKELVLEHSKGQVLEHSKGQVLEPVHSNELVLAVCSKR